MRQIRWLLVGIGLMAAGAAWGKPKYLAPAKKIRPEVTGCLSCHTTLPPTRDGLTAMGLYLRKRKEREQAPEVEVQWLRDYPSAADAPVAAQ